MALIPEDIRIIEIDMTSVPPVPEVDRGTADFYVDLKRGRWTSQKITGEDKAVQWLGIGCKTEIDTYPIYGEFGTPFEALIREQLPRATTEGEMLRGVERLGEQHEWIRTLDVDVEFKGNQAAVGILVNDQQERVVVTR